MDCSPGLTVPKHMPAGIVNFDEMIETKGKQ
jgi:hypothetical protein